MIVCLMCQLAAWLLSISGHRIMGGLGLIAAAVWIYVEEVRKSGNPVHLRALFSASFLGGEGLAVMKLSGIGIRWTAPVWISLMAAFAGFYMTWEVLEKEQGGGYRRSSFGGRRNRENSASSVLFAAAAICGVSLACFIIEAVVLGYVPLFVRGVPHAYSAFHLKGVHYFTVSCVLVPPLAVLYFLSDRGRTVWGTRLMALLALVSLAIPVLCVSRFQLVFSILLAAVVYIRVNEGIPLPYAAAAGAVGLVLLLVISAARSHDAAYLNAVFEMKNDKLPLFLSQPYIYIANNYENFALLVQSLPAHTFGRRMLVPLWTFTGLKFLFPNLTALPLYFVKEELTTTTIFYDAWYDFGVIGVLLFSVLLGAAAFLVNRESERNANPVIHLFYAQMAVYLLFSFFTAWFSLPATWFYFAVTGLAALAVRLGLGAR